MGEAGAPAVPAATAATAAAAAEEDKPRESAPGVPGNMPSHFPRSLAGLTLPGICSSVGCSMDQVAAAVQAPAPSAAQQ